MKQLLIALLLPMLSFASDIVVCDGDGELIGVSSYSSTPAPTPPTMTSATIPAAGNVVNIVFSEAITAGTGGNAGWSLTSPSSTMTYASGDTTDTWQYSLGTIIKSTATDNPVISYTQPGDGLEDSDGDDLASIVSGDVTNNSTQGNEVTYGATAAGTSGQFVGTYAVYTRAVTISSDGTTTKIGGYFSSNTSTSYGIKLALYTKVGNDPAVQVGPEVEITVPGNVTDQLIETTYSHSVTAGDYYIAEVVENSNIGPTYHTGVSGDRRQASPPTVYDMEANWADMSSGSWGTSIMAVFIKVQ